MRGALKLASAHPGRSTLLLLSLLVSSVLGGVGLVSIVPLLGLVIEGGADPTAGAASPVTERVNAALLALGIEPTVGALVLLIVGALCAKALVQIVADRQVAYSVSAVAMELRLQLLRSLMGARWSYFTGQPLGRIANAFSAEATRSGQAYLFAAGCLAAALEAAVALLIAFSLSWRMTLATVAIGAALVSVRALLVGVTRRAGQRQTHVKSELQSLLADSLQAAKPLKAMGRERLVEPLLTAQTLRLNRVLRRQVFSKMALKTVEEPLIAIVLGVGLFLALSVWSRPADEVLALALLFARVLLSVGTVQRRFQDLAGEESALLALQERILWAEAQREQDGGTRRVRLEHGLALQDVDLSYGDHTVLRGASLAIPAGEITALVIADLVLGLVRPDRGEVRIDGVEIGDLDLHAWRTQVGYVPQEMFLLHDTVLANVCMGDAELDRADVEEALRRAGAWEFVDRLPEGLDSVVGERGSLLSGGQRQRIAIARAIVHRPRLLILDEVSTSLDPETEERLWESVASLRGETTILAVSHQPALAAIADRVYQVERGSVAPPPQAVGERPVTAAF
jgi:ATP-binding cassette subfamily C protein